MKDAEYAARCGIEAVIMERIKANLACDKALNELPRPKGGVEQSEKESSSKEVKPSSDTAENKASNTVLDDGCDNDASTSPDTSPSRFFPLGHTPLKPSSIIRC
ncbi:hypothetical protein OSTOST_03110 [Ostertagia ostertagi]